MQTDLNQPDYQAYPEFYVTIKCVFFMSKIALIHCLNKKGHCEHLYIYGCQHCMNSMSCLEYSVMSSFVLSRMFS